MASSSFKGNDWIESAIKEKEINFFEFDEFYDREVIGMGAFGEVYRANVKNNDLTVALKSLFLRDKTEEINKKFIKELKFLMELNKNSVHNKNVIRFYGITKDLHARKYMMVMQYANGGTLEDYLNANFSNLAGNDKLNLAKQLVRGLKCIHDANIIHRDLNHNNILVHKGKIKIADLGYSKLSNDKSNSKTNAGMLCYNDPAFVSDMETYIRNQKSDIYSLGVLLWVICSGRIPNMYTNIRNEKGKLIHGTPDKYVKLYQACLDDLPENRPDIYEVNQQLNELEWPSEPNIYDVNELEWQSNQISMIKIIGNGAFGEVYRAEMKNEYLTVALKYLYLRDEKDADETNMRFIKELKMLIKLNHNKNIISFYGITKDLSTQKYMMVMEYADGGTLKDYLYTNFSKLTGNDKLNLAKQLAQGLKSIHNAGIIHRDLNHNNILIHEEKIKITGFGYSKLSDDHRNSGSDYGVLCYIDPAFLRDTGDFMRNKQSDIFSLGVLFWVISSGRIPSNKFGYIFSNPTDEKEITIFGTPNKYVALYKQCWNDVPNNRPDIYEVNQRLDELEWSSEPVDNNESELDPDSLSFSSLLTLSLHEMDSEDE